jgi:hypothetical protein
MTQAASMELPAFAGDAADVTESDDFSFASANTTRQDAWPRGIARSRQAPTLMQPPETRRRVVARIASAWDDEKCSLQSAASR